MQKLSIIIPVYNEENTVKQVIEKTKNLELPKSIKKEIIVVDDGSIDKSFDILRKIDGVKILRYRKNKGKGAAVRTALKHLTGDYFIIQDADIELDPKEILKIIKPVLEKKAIVVYGSRRLNQKAENRTPLFWLGGQFITFMTNFLYGTKLTDEPCGYKLFKTEIVKNFKIEENRFGWEPEITAKISKKGVKIYEVAINFKSRSTKQGKKLKRRDGLRAAWVLLREKFR